MKNLRNGILIAVEGIDGSGKSTLVKNIAQRLMHNNFPTTQTREPGATELGAHLRSLLLPEKQYPTCQKAEYLLFASDRAQHFAQLIQPALQENKIVISDRMADSSIVYQGYGRGLDKEMIKQINRWSMNDITPNLTIYVRVSVDTALERLKKRNSIPTSFEKEKRSFTQILITGFDELLLNSEHALVLDGTNTPEELTHASMQVIMNYIDQKELCK